MKTEFDFIIYGASIAGCLLSVAIANEGKNVLLINNFGFPGGSITESLNCFQKTGLIKSELLKNLLSEIEKDPFGIQFEGDNKFILNPEIVKYQLLKILADSSVISLFHAHPFEIEIIGNNRFLSISLREGINKIQYNKLIDATDNHDLFISLFHEDESIYSQSINCIISKTTDESFLNFEYIKEAIKLNDGRYWISLAPNKYCYTNTCIQNILDDFSTVLSKCKSRIQLLPTKYLLDYDKIENNNKIDITVKNDITNKQFETDDILLEADSILNSYYQSNKVNK